MDYKLKGKKLGGDERFWGERWVELKGWSKRLMWSRWIVYMNGIIQKNLRKQQLLHTEP